MSERGVFAVDRGIWEHPTLAEPGPYSLREAWIWLLSQAAWKPHRKRVGSATIEIGRGQVAHSYRFISEAWGWKLGKVQRFLGRLKTDTMIDTRSDTGVLVISICNYDKYQRVSLPGDTPSDTPADTLPIHDRYKVEDKENKELDNTSDLAGKSTEAKQPIGKPSKAASDDAFERFRAAYPKRKGVDPRANAKKRFDAKVKGGADPERIIAGAKAFAAAEAKRGAEGTEFIPHSATWLNRDGWEDHFDAPGTVGATAADDVESWRIPVANWRNDPTSWTSHAWGPAPGEPGSAVSTTILAKLGVEARRAA
ncbi:hypothetical protein [Bosea lathyri]|uniref:Uncharacterized protein n=1 Tax=Bosea lathyri TaxID=1036778 RepID=A0A1H6BKJ4_9HYPH|nr:hypothetical protein [Bosea lathyri]SEG61203.1 hypothetical protein SAMN04488115_107317 [Bosea lathyri]